MQGHGILAKVSVNFAVAYNAKLSAGTVPEIFGTFNVTTASPAEVKLSQTMQTTWINFIKDPTSPPAPGWPRFTTSKTSNGLAKLSFQGNVKLVDVVQPALGSVNDGPCDILFNQFLDF